MRILAMLTTMWAAAALRPLMSLRDHVCSPPQSGTRFRLIPRSEAPKWLEGAANEDDRRNFIHIANAFGTCEVVAAEMAATVHAHIGNAAALYLMEFDDSTGAGVLWACLWRGDQCENGESGPELEMALFSELQKRVKSYRSAQGIKGLFVDARPQIMHKPRVSDN